MPMLLWASGFVLATALYGRGADADDAPGPGFDGQVERWTAWHQARDESAGERFIRHGLVADRHAGHIDLLAETTTMSALEPVEFLLIGPRSGHDYEAFARSYATPGDLYDALLFLGVPAGQRVNFPELRHWPRGERIQASIRFMPPDFDGTPAQQPADVTWIPGEHLVFSDGELLPGGSGFVFTGSYRVPDPRQPGNEALVADIREPYSLISLYNEPRTVLDVPYIAPQGTVYGSQRLNSEYLDDEPRLVTFRLTPDLLPDGPRSVDVDMQVRGGARRARSPFSGVLVNASNRWDGSVILNADLTRWLAFLERIQAQGRDIYIHVTPDSSMLLEAVVRLYSFLDDLNVPRGARLNGRPGNDIYYQAFLPPQEFRQPEKRPGQPWELHLYQDPSLAVTGRLTRFEEVWDEQQVELIEHAYEAPTPEAMLHTIKQTPGVLKVVLVFAPETMSYGQLREWYDVLPDDHRTWYVYLRDTPDDIIIDDRPTR